MKRKIKTELMKSFYKIESSHLLSIVRRGLTMMIPVLVMGAVTSAMLHFPNESFRYLITVRFPVVSRLLEAAYQGTFGMFSMILVISLSISYAMEKSKEMDEMFFYVITAVASFGTQIGLADEETKLAILENTGCFLALIVGMLSCFMFSKLRQIERISLSKYTVGMETIPANAIQSIFPAAITIGSFALVQYILTTVSGENSVYTLLSGLTYRGFEGVANSFVSGLLYTVLVHAFWILGFHGSHMMETVALNNFSIFGDGIIFSKSFFDTFVIMGGSGATICALIGIFFFVHRKRVRNIGKIALPTGIFNANEILTFGIPIILNPVLAIPFVCVPIMALIVSYTATALGLVPYVVNDVPWTMPFIFSGYMATGSIAGSVLQLVIVIIGVAMYVPFLKMYEEIYDLRMEEKIKNLTEKLQECEIKGESPDFLQRVDDSGMVARMLLQELRKDLKDKKLYLVYQPQVDQNGKYIGGEALIRWRHLQYGFIYPPLIVYLATEGGDFRRIGTGTGRYGGRSNQSDFRKLREEF